VSGPIFYILFVLGAHWAEVQPEVVTTASTREECLDTASKLNASQPIVRSEEAKKAGARFMCFEYIPNP
jgi:hypothetical protein